MLASRSLIALGAARACRHVGRRVVCTANPPEPPHTSQDATIPSLDATPAPHNHNNNDRTRPTPRRIAVLVDGDNASGSALGNVLAGVEQYGQVAEIVVFGDFSNPSLLQWREPMKEHGARAVHHFSGVGGKNCSDIALSIAALDIMHAAAASSSLTALSPSLPVHQSVQGVCIVSGDGDFAPLAFRIRQAGLLVMGIGQSHNAQVFRSACDIYLTKDQLPLTAEQKAEKKALLKVQQERLDKEKERLERQKEAQTEAAERMRIARLEAEAADDERAMALEAQQQVEEAARLAKEEEDAKWINRLKLWWSPEPEPEPEPSHAPAIARTAATAIPLDVEETEDSDKDLSDSDGLWSASDCESSDSESDSDREVLSDSAILTLLRESVAEGEPSKLRWVNVSDCDVILKRKGFVAKETRFKRLKFAFAGFPGDFELNKKKKGLFVRRQQ